MWMSPSATMLWRAWTRTGDRVALERIVLPEIPHAVAWARRLGCTEADAEDAAQEALTRLAGRRDDEPANMGFRAWICREVRNRASSWRRSERRRRAREAAVAVPESRERAPEGPTLSVREEVERVLASLAAEERQAVELRFLHDLDYRSVAFVLGVSQGAARQRVHAAVGRLRERFGRSASAVVATLPLPAGRRSSVIFKHVLAASTGGASHIGALLMAAGAQKAWGIGLAAAAVVTGALVVDKALDPGGRSPEVAEAAREMTAAAVPQTLAAAPTLQGAPARSQAPGEAPSPGPLPVPPGSYLARGESWRKAVLGSDLPAREMAWSEVRAALAGTDVLDLLAALHAAAFTGHVAPLDRTGVREALDRLCDAADWQTCAMAWTAVVSTSLASRGGGQESEAEAIDFERFRLKIERCPDEVRSRLLGALVMAQNHDLDDASEDLVVRLLRDPAKAAETVKGVGRATRVSDRVMSEVLEAARQSPLARQDVQRYVLRGHENKSREAVVFLLEGVESQTPQALECLARGVRAEDAAFAGAWLRRIFTLRQDAAIRQQIVNTLGYMRDASSRDWLREIGETDASLTAAAAIALRNLDGEVKARHGRGQPR